MTNNILNSLIIINVPKAYYLKLLMILAIIIALALFGVYAAYNSIFRLSKDDVSKSLIGTPSECNRLDKCQLLAGDIFIRRSITEKTRLFDTLVNPYFTHAVFYYGNSKVIEATGVERNHQDEITLSNLSKSEWIHKGVEGFVIIRPKYSGKQLYNIKGNLKAVAQDPDYRFGLSQLGNKQTSCADLIIKQLINEKVTKEADAPGAITPDYLFWLAANTPEKFKIIGYNEALLYRGEN